MFVTAVFAAPPQAQVTAVIAAPPQLQTGQLGPAGGGVRLKAAQIFQAAAELAACGDISRAIELLKVLTHDPHPDLRAEARVRIARLLAEKGDFAGAALSYRALLDEKPDAAAVRIELATLLARMGYERSAANELRRAEAAGLPDDVARALRTTANALRGRAGFAATLSIGLAPDTNINSATASETVAILGLPFKLDDDGRARSGIGLTFAGQVIARQKFGGNQRWISQVDAVGNLYRRGEFNDISVSVSTGPDFALRGARLHPSFSLGRRIFGKEWLYNFYGTTLTGLFPAGKRSQIEATVSLVEFDYAANRRGQSGPIASGGVALERAFSPRLSGRLGFTVSHTTANDTAYSATGYGLESVLSRDVRRATVFVRGNWARLNGEGVFALFGRPRRDTLYGAEAGLLMRQYSFLGLSPQATVSYIRSDSPIEFYHFDRIRAIISLQKTF